MWSEGGRRLSYRKQVTELHRRFCRVVFTRIVGYEFSTVAMSPAFNYCIYNTNSNRWNFNPKNYIVTQVPRLPTRLVFDFQDSAKLLGIIGRVKGHMNRDNLYLSKGGLVGYSKVHKHQYISLESKSSSEVTHILSVERSHFKRNPHLTNSTIEYGGYENLQLSKPLIVPTISFDIVDKSYAPKVVYLEDKVHETILIETLVSLNKPQVIYLLPQHKELLKDLAKLSGAG